MTAFDLVVIGSGPAGEGAAMQAAKAKLRVCVVERKQQVGGGCTHWGTIPSKALRHAVQKMVEFKTSNFFGLAQENTTVPFSKLLHSADDVVRKQVEMRQSFYDRNHVQLIHGDARFLDPNQLLIVAPDGHEERITSKAFLIATGSRPYHPVDVDFTHPRIFDSDTILKLNRDPSSITIYGAGVIGCEYASIFRNFGIKVNLVNQREKLLSFLDDEIIDALAYHLRDQGVILRHQEEYESIEPLEDGVVLNLKSGKRLKTDILLWANGRSGNTQGLQLETIGIQPDHRGNLSVNESYQTNVPHVYAAGDVIGPPALASASYDQGRAAVQHLAYGTCPPPLSRHVPAGIYTSPEISCIGRTERELTEARTPYEVGHSHFRSLARAQITGRTVGILKILFHRETLEVLGIHCFGDQASEIIHIGQVVMTGGHNSLNYFVNTTFNYPTMAEAYRVAALNGLNRLF
ncbi:MAG: Si-specific NAD(P)(+) transhydrogenase [Polyangiaceae bacterium]